MSDVLLGSRGGWGEDQEEDPEEDREDQGLTKQTGNVYGAPERCWCTDWRPVKHFDVSQTFFVLLREKKRRNQIRDGVEGTIFQ